MNTWQYCVGNNKYIVLVITIVIPIAISIFLGLRNRNSTSQPAGTAQVSKLERDGSGGQR